MVMLELGTVVAAGVNANRGRVLDLLRAQANRGAVVVMATHDPEAAAVCDGEVQLDEGRLTRVR
jgi:putative ABC transport system ATP-binding protein